MGCHHGELHEGVGGELVLDDAHLAETGEVEGAGLVLVHQVGEPHLCEADGLLELRGEAPADVVRRGVGRQLVGLAEGARTPHLEYIAIVSTARTSHLQAHGCRLDWWGCRLALW